MRSPLNNTVKVGFCVAYDWRFLSYSIPQVYKSADVICLSIDKDRISWSHRPFLWEETEFQNMLKSVDPLRKIIVYEDDFHVVELSASENEKRQRNLMAKAMGLGGWHVQLDCDEYFLDFDGFVRYLRRLPGRPYKFNVSCQLITIFKQIDRGYAYVYPRGAKSFEFLPVASRHPCYDHGRRNGHFNILSDFAIVHQSWARTEEEIKIKVANWGHVNDFAVQSYFYFWKGINKHNYREARFFHPIKPEVWPSLELVNGIDPNDLISHFKLRRFPALHPVRRFISNSILVSRVLHQARFIQKWLKGFVYSIREIKGFN